MIWVYWLIVNIAQGVVLQLFSFLRFVEFLIWFASEMIFCCYFYVNVFICIKNCVPQTCTHSALLRARWTNKNPCPNKMSARISYFSQPHSKKTFFQLRTAIRYFGRYNTFSFVKHFCNVFTIESCK